MRDGWVFPGVILMLLMLIFAFVPLPSSASGEASELKSLMVNPPSFELSGSGPLVVQWSGGNGNTWIQVLPCSNTACTNVNTHINGTPQAPVSWSAQGYGGSGTFSFWAPTNATMIVLTNSVTVLSITITWNEMPEFHLFWEILALVGILLAVVGILLPASHLPRGTARTGRHYLHWRHQEFSLPAHLPAEGLTCVACGLTDIPHEDVDCPKCHAPLTPEALSTEGRALLVEDSDPLKVWRVLHGLKVAPPDVMIVTREDPELLKTKFGLQEATILRLTRLEADDAVSPKDVDRIAHLSEEHMEKHPGGLMVLTDPQYFVSHVGFENLHRLIQELQDLAHAHKGTFLLSFNPETFKEAQISQIEERMRRLL